MSAQSTTEDDKHFLWDPKSVHENVFIRAPARQDKQKEKEIPHAYASFGNDGLTVSVNEYGHIMQISRYMGFGSSGFLCVDSRYPPPYYVQSRMETMMQSSTDPNHGFRLDLVDWTEDLSKPSLGFMYDRWPRYVFGRTSSTTQEEENENRTGAVETSTQERADATESAQNSETNKQDSKKTTFDIKTCPLSIQYHCSGDTVIQKYLIRLGDNGLPRKIIDNYFIDLSPNVCIRGLDFDRGAKFDDDFADAEYKSTVIPQNHLVIKHDIPKEFEDERNVAMPTTSGMTKKPVAALLVVSPFIGDESAEIRANRHIDVAAEEGQTELEVTVAYTLKLLYEDTLDWSDSLEDPELERQRQATSKNVGFAKECTNEVAKAKDKMNKTFKGDSDFRRVCFAKDPRLDFAFRRNIEHILSVCSVPITKNQQQSKPEAIAITCGDIAGHRVASRASLSAFQYLCSILPYIGNSNPNDLRYAYLTQSRKLKKQSNMSEHSDQPTKNQNTSDASVLKKGQTSEQDPSIMEAKKEIDDYLVELHGRIRNTLSGHMRWILEHAEYDAGVKKPNCNNARCNLRCGPFSPHYWPTGYHIHDTEYLSPPSLIDSPLQLLKIVNFKDFEVDPELFERLKLQPNLDAIVCSWIKELHKLNKRGTFAFLYQNDQQETEPKYRLTDHVMVSLTLKSKLSSFQGLHSPSEHYRYEQVRKKVLKRFTTEHPTSKQRTLATGRWKSKTRYLLHSKDTFLFTAANMGFFCDKDLDSHDSRKFHAGRRSDPWAYANDRWAKLLESQAYHDEFQLMGWGKPLWWLIILVLASKQKKVNGKPTEEIIFEAGEVLLACCWYNGLFPGQFGLENTQTHYDRELERDEFWLATFEIPHILWNFDAAGNISKRLVRATDSSVSVGSAENVVTRTGQQVEKYLPFINFSVPKINATRFGLSDDWLEPAPSFLKFESGCDSELGPRSPSPTHSGSSLGSELGSEIRSYFDALPEKHGADSCVVIDVPKKSKDAELTNTGPSGDKKPEKRLEDPRTVWNSKKRIVWLSDPDNDMLSCVHSSCSSAEQVFFQSFLSQHASRKQYFLDYPNASLNEWQTELHLFFLTFAESEAAKFDLTKKSTYPVMRRVSFRFSGDFSDRHWTCYFLETGGKKIGRYGLLDDLSPDDEQGVKAQRAHKSRKSGRYQRTVLEIRIFNEMLDDICDSTAKILEVVNLRLLEAEALNTNGDSKMHTTPFDGALAEAACLHWLGREQNYDKLVERWQHGSPILKVIVENLENNIAKIKEWIRREEDRKGREPPWTVHDIEHYDAERQFLKVRSLEQVRRLEDLKSKVQAFQSSLPAQLTRIQDEISFRGSQSINLFTYVTVVFLPLGFATGLLSMGGPPDHALLMNLVTLSLGSLGVTLFALLNARTTKLAVTQLVKPFLFVTRRTRMFIRQCMIYAFFHLVTRRKVSSTPQYQEWKKDGASKKLEKRQVDGGKLKTQEFDQSLFPQQDERQGDVPGQSDQSGKQQTLEPVTSNHQKRTWQVQWHQKYEEIVNFSYPAALQSLGSYETPKNQKTNEESKDDSLQQKKGRKRVLTLFGYNDDKRSVGSGTEGV